MRLARLLAPGLAGTLLAATAASVAAPVAAEEAPGPRVELVVEFAPGTSPSERAEALDDADAEVVAEVADDFAVVEVPADAAPEVAAGDGVVDVDRPVPMAALGVPNDPMFPRQWHLAEVGASEAWDTATGEGVVVAVVDTGLDRAPDLAGTDVVAGYDFVDDDANPEDENGHGTHVAGTIAQTTNNGLGGAGIAPGASLMPLRALDEDGSGYDVDVAAAIDFAVEHGADVINLSLGGASPSNLLHAAIEHAVEAGVVVVAAAGNDGGLVAYPAAYPEVIAVGATTRSRSLASFSAHGPQLDLVAPGVDIIQQTRAGSRWCWCAYTGTSMAAPHVAGTAALLLSAGADGADVRTLLESTAVDLGRTGRDDRYGAGLVQAAAAVAAVRPARPVPTLAGPPAAGTTPAPGTGARQASPALNGPSKGTVQDIDDACPATVPPGRFADVSPTSVHARAVACVAWLGIAAGTGTGAFGPDRSVTRGQMAAFLARLLEAIGVDLPAAPADAFVDDDGTVHEAAINALAALGLVAGTGGRRFAPEEPVSRAAMATFLVAVHDWVAAVDLPAGTDTFADDEGMVHESAIDRLAGAGLVAGTGPGSYAPRRAVSRAQMATFLARVLDRLLDEGEATPRVLVAGSVA